MVLHSSVSNEEAVLPVTTHDSGCAGFALLHSYYIMSSRIIFFSFNVFPFARGGGWG
jgi:hypothetical protein